MNWLDHENSPRKRPPLSHGVQSIARVQPLVPEVSMWMSSSHGILDQSLEEQNQEEEEKEETIIRQKPAEPENTRREESQISAKVNPPTIIQSPNTASTTQGDLYQLLRSQSEQIASLHEALRKLILDRSIDAPSTNKTETREIGVQTQPFGSPKVVTDQATQCQRDDKYVKPRYESPVRVESTSVSSSESKESEEVLDQLQRACMRGSTEKALNPGRANDSVGDTMSRLRNLGISFVDRNHLKDVPISDTRFDSNYPLGLKALGDTNFSTVQSIASDSSMAINSAALKYLDDRQLTALANNRGGRPKNGPLEHEPRDSGVTKYGLPLQQLSIHTKNFLENTVEPASRNREGKNDILENLTQLLQQPKLRP